MNNQNTKVKKMIMIGLNDSKTLELKHQKTVEKLEMVIAYKEQLEFIRKCDLFKPSMDIVEDISKLHR